MVLRKKSLRKVILFATQVGFVVLAATLIFREVIKQYIKSPVLVYVSENIEFLKLIILLTFIFGSLILILIVWLLEWGDKQQRSAVTRYISQLVCENYYGNYRKTNVYRAIKTALSKFSRETMHDEGSDPDAMGSSGVRYVDPRRYAIKNYAPQKIQMPTECTDDGIQRAYFPSGKLEKEVTYNNHVPDGPYRSFYEDGTIHQERVYKEGKLHGNFRAYDEFGVPYFDIIYRDGKQHGITRIYFKNGALQYLDTFENGKRVHRETYNESGELKFSQQEYNA